jgi:hypothetical protein
MGPDPDEEPSGIKPETWGPTVWALVHTFAELADRLEGASEARAFFSALGPTLPCRKCREAYARHTKAIRLGTSVVEYARKLHSAVNEDLGKRTYGRGDMSLFVREAPSPKLARVLARAMRRSVEYFDACIREREFFDDAETHEALAARLAMSGAVRAIRRRVGTN